MSPFWLTDPVLVPAPSSSHLPATCAAVLLPATCAAVLLPATFTAVDRLYMLEGQCGAWGSIVSAAVHVALVQGQIVSGG
jgi:hypothetical protein